MPIRVECPNCGKALSAPGELAGKAAKCSECSTKIDIPLVQVAHAGHRVARSQTKPKKANLLGHVVLAAVAAAVGFFSGMAFVGWSNSNEIATLVSTKQDLSKELRESQQANAELQGILQVFEQETPSENVVLIDGDDSGHSQPEVKPGQFLGVSRKGVLESIQKLYAIREIEETPTKLQAKVGQDNVIMIEGSEKNIRAITIFGSLTEANARDMARVMYFAWRAILPKDEWLEEWLPVAITKVDVGYTIAAQHKQIKTELRGFIFEETPLIFLSLSPAN